MKFACDREKLLAVYLHASAFAAQRSGKPVLQSVRMEVDSTSDTAVLTATDGDVGVRVSLLDCGAEKSGTVLLPSRFGAWMRESTDEQVEVESTKSGIVVQGSRGQMRLQNSDPDEHPGVAVTSEACSISLAAAALRTLIHRTVFACDVGSNRFALEGVYLEIASEQLIAVATDGRRMAKISAACETIGTPQFGDGPGGNSGLILPARAAQLVERSLVGEEGVVHLEQQGNAMVVRTQSMAIVSRLVEGRFPRWRDVLPKTSTLNSVAMVAGPVEAALRQAAIVTDKESRGVTFSLSEGRLELACTTADVGASQVELPVAYSDAPISITLDSRYLQQFLKVLDPTAEVSLYFNSPENAVLLESGDYQYVLMPLVKNA